jgi:hypothetical protein
MKVGDKVKVVAKHSAHEGKVGTVVPLTAGDGIYERCVRFDGENRVFGEYEMDAYPYFEDELELLNEGDVTNGLH